jgi:hypothetical protein
VADLGRFLFTYLIVNTLTITAVEYERLQRRLSIVPLHSTGPKKRANLEDQGSFTYLSVYRTPWDQEDGAPYRPHRGRVSRVTPYLRRKVQ